jgi:hypothetical protein
VSDQLRFDGSRTVEEVVQTMQQLVVGKCLKRA